MDPQAPGPAEIDCGNCGNYRRRHTDDAAHAAAAAVGHAISPGMCALKPQMLAKQPWECCSQHSQLVLNRMQRQAEMIGEAVTKALDAAFAKAAEAK